MSPPPLTIIIPTFNRPEKLKGLVTALLPQRSDRWRLLVVDNHSEPPACDVLPDDVKIVRNPVNIGVAGNFPRCFELADTDWVWLIGDDDMVDPDAVKRVLAAIDAYPDAAILNFGCHDVTDSRSATRVLVGVDEFLDKCDSLRASIWITANVHARKHYWPIMGLAYRFGNTQSAHYVLLLLALIRGGTFVQFQDPVCRQTGETTTSTSQGELMNSVMSLADLPLNKRQRRTYAKRMQKEAIPFISDLMHCAYQMQDKTDREEILFLFFTRWTHWSLVRGSLCLFCATFLARLVLGCAAGRALIRGVTRLKEILRGTPSQRRPHVPRFYRQI